MFSFTFNLAANLESLTGFTLSLLFVAMIAIMFIGWIFSASKPKPGLSPYTKTPLRPFTDLPYFTVSKVESYMEAQKGYENQMFNFFRAAFCRETGRIFPDAISWWGKIRVDWTFLNKRKPGNYVSWGSLLEEQKRSILEAHRGLDGFQTIYSSSKPRPRDIEREYVYKKPGPLYVNLETKELLGWKCVPETDLEVLILQKPFQRVYDYEQ
ncbi:MAG: hypothetical protein Tsb0021_00370 [Chlamydiales bacterium]